MNVEDVVNATVDIRVADESIGSGFRFVQEDVVVTNSHILPPDPGAVPITGATAADTESKLEVVAASPEPHRDGDDFAILRAIDGFERNSDVLQPATGDLNRGDTVWFAGHPFEISEPLVHAAMVSGPHPHGFYLDGSVNFGNSGGPVVTESGRVGGIITESEIYESHSIEESINDLYGIQERMARIQEVHESEINGVHVEGLKMDSIQTIQEAISILTENVSSGIGVGYGIEPVLEGLKNLES
jgi:S1-C subfamily serine protease